MFGRPTAAAVMMTSPYCTAVDYTRDLYGAADATFRQHRGLTLRHQAHPTGAIYRHPVSSTSSSSSADVKFERGSGCPSGPIESAALHGPSGVTASGKGWNGQSEVFDASASQRGIQRGVGHSFHSVSLDGSTVSSNWHSFQPTYVQPYSPCELNISGFEAREHVGLRESMTGETVASSPRQCVNCGAPLNSLSRLDLTTGHYLCSWCYGNGGGSNNDYGMTSHHDVMGYASRTISRKPVGNSGSRRTGLRCVNCGCTASTLWRRNNEGDTVCNACGLYYKLHGINRPPTMRKDGIQTRKRRPKGPKGLSACGGGGGSDEPTSEKSPTSPRHRQQPQLQIVDSKLSSPSDSHSDTYPRPASDDVKSNGSHDCYDAPMVATSYGGWASENMTTDKISFRSSAADVSMPLCFAVNSSPIKRQVACDKQTNGAKPKGLRTEMSQCNNKVSESYACLIQSRLANCSQKSDAPWYGVSNLPTGAIPVMTSEERQRDYVIDDISGYSHDLATRRYCGEDVGPERRRYAY